MKALLKTKILSLFILISWCGVDAGPRAGFYMPDSIHEVSFKFRNFNNLIIIPVTINDTLQVNLILDTGCRNLVLFGKKFLPYFKIEPNKEIQFSGLGQGNAITAGLSINNKVSIGQVLGERIPVVIAAKKNLFGKLEGIDGVIGYDIFIKFEIELNPVHHLITFRPAMQALRQEGYIEVPVRIEDSRPLLTSSILFEKNTHSCDLMIDTGSSLGLLLKTTDLKKFKISGSKDKIIGRGFNGLIKGFDLMADKLSMTNFEISYLPASVTHSPWHNYASIGMDILKDYAIILNYCKEYICFKKL
jgi:hypothetical protein